MKHGTKSAKQAKDYAWNVETSYPDCPGVWWSGDNFHFTRREAREEKAEWHEHLPDGWRMRVVKYRRVEPKG